MVLSKTIKHFNWYAFFMAFPVLLFLGQNFSLLFFILFWISLKNKASFLKLNFGIQKVIIFFALGAIISTFDPNIEVSDKGLSDALVVLPNYLYWSILLIVIINFRNNLNLIVLSKFIFFGLVATLLYQIIPLTLIKSLFFLNIIYANTFAFLCIAFTAPALVYLAKRFGTTYALLLLLIILFFLLFMERRAGFSLVFLTSIMSLLFVSLQFKKILLAVFLGLLAYLFIQTSFVESYIYNISPRIHESIYASDNITTEDRSYLLRRLMVEKTLIIFNEHPFTGIGLNSFTNYDVQFIGDFDGSQFIVNKDGTNEKSAHNSYASILAEGGLFLFIPFVLLLLFNIIHFFKSFTKRSQIENAFYWSFLGMCIHLYFISAILNVFAWFLIGIVTALSVKSQRGELNRFSSF